jgi:hypothetical protein
MGIYMPMALTVVIGILAMPALFSGYVALGSLALGLTLELRTSVFIVGIIFRARGDLHVDSSRSWFLT